MSATASEMRGLREAVEAAPFDPTPRLILADALAEAGDAEGEAWMRWAASKCDEMARGGLRIWRLSSRRDNEIVCAGRLFGSKGAATKALAGRAISRWAVVGEETSPTLTRRLLRIVDDREVRWYAHLCFCGCSVSPNRKHARRILREAFGTEGDA